MFNHRLISWLSFIVSVISGTILLYGIAAESGMEGPKVWYWAGAYSLIAQILAWIIIRIFRYYQPAKFTQVLWVISMSFIPYTIAQYTPGADYRDAWLSHTYLLQYAGTALWLGGVSIYASARKAQQVIRLRNEWLTQQEKLQSEAELFHLKQQFQPHFLFNSLNSVYALTLSNPVKAGEMILSLSEFLRAGIHFPSDAFISLKEEWNLVTTYLEIEKQRFSLRLNIESNIPDECMNHKIPALVLQPLIENAIKHGLYGNNSPCTITLDARMSGQNLNIQICNPMSLNSDAPGSGFGLNGIRRRLALLYHRNDLISIQKENNTFTLQLNIPHVESY